MASSVATAAAIAPTAKLLFCHGGGFCQEVWNPIKERLRKSPLLRDESIEMLSFDFPYHGSRRDVSQPARLDLEDPAAPRVFHPGMNWFEWGPKEVYRQVQQIRSARANKGSDREPLIGIGHSMGAISLWIVEMRYPGTFDGLVLFEPISNLDPNLHSHKTADYLISLTLKRRANWYDVARDAHFWDCWDPTSSQPSFQEAEADLMSSKNFARWHPESLRAYIAGAVVADPICIASGPGRATESSAGPCTLSCPPHFEAALYSAIPPVFSESDMKRVQCPITLQYGGRSQLFFPQVLSSVFKKYPDLYSLADPIPDASHAMIMEDPDTTADRILTALNQLPVCCRCHRTNTTMRSSSSL